MRTVSHTTPMPFNNLAAEYDRLNQINPCIRYIREEFRKKIVTFVPDSKDIHCLDIGCGTGEDAIYFAKKGWKVTGIDQSEEMIRLATDKIIDKSPVEFSIQDFNVLSAESFPEKEFDLIYSNFGALNCLVDLKKFAATAARFLKPGGTLAINMLGKFYPVEIITFGRRGKWSVAIRRLKRNPVAQVGEQVIRVNYWSSGEIIQTFKKSGFRPVLHSAIAWFIPAPYFFDGRPSARLPGLFEKIDAHLGKYFPFNRWGDHTYYFFKKV